MRGFVYSLALPCIALGCSEWNTLVVPIELTFQGANVPGELSFEPLDPNGTSVGRAIRVVIPDSGHARASLPRITPEMQRYRITVRVASPKPSLNDDAKIANQEFGVGVKTVPLIRDLANGQALYLAITL